MWVGLISEKEGEQVHQRGLGEPCEEVFSHYGRSYWVINISPGDYNRNEKLCERCKEVDRVVGTEACIDVCKRLHSERIEVEILP